jgi:hypothetical protein
MALAWNTRQLTSAASGGEVGSATPVEFHFLSRRELYDSTILTADRHHSSAGQWAVLGDGHWYSVAVVTHPTYAIPQELCLSFDCFDETDQGPIATISGPPVDDVALEFGALLSLLAREPLLPLGTRRLGGKPCKLDSPGLAPPTSVFRTLPPKGIDSTKLNAVLRGLSRASDDDSNAILAATRLYHAALSLSAYDVSTAYFSLVMAVECLSGHHLSQRKFNFDEVEKFKKVNEVIAKLSASGEIVDELKREILRSEYFVWQKFRTFIQEFLPEEFWQEKDELHPELRGTLLLEIDKLKLAKVLSEVYSARSKFTHAGTPFPAYVEFGIGDRMTSKAAVRAMNIAGSRSFVPPFIWFERLTHSVLCEYLFRVISPEVAEDRARYAIEKARVFETINGLCERQLES